MKMPRTRTSARLVLLAAVTALAGLLCASAQEPKLLQGMLRSVDLHAAGGLMWALQETSTGDNYMLPGQPRDAISGQQVPRGSRIMLQCVLAPAPPGKSWNVCGEVSSVMVTAAAAPYISNNVAINYLVIRVNVQGTCATACTGCTGAPVWSEQQIRDIFATSYTPYWEACSFGTFKVNPTNFRVISVTIGCSSATMVSACDWESMGKLADTAAQAQLGATTWALYDRTDKAGKRSYVMPAGMVNTCGFGGLAWTPGVQTWLPSDAYNGIQSKQTVFHEMIHTFGLGHSRYNGIEYGDSTSPMGQGSGCPSAPEMRRLRWATPLADFAITTLTPRIYRRYTLPALASKAAQSFLRITTTTQNLYVSYRAKGWGDQELGAEYDKKLVVHRVSSLAIDNDASQTAWGDAQNELMAWAGVGSGVDLPTYKLYVAAVAIGGTTMVVDVCYYTSSKADCKSANPSPTISPSPRPSPTLSPSPRPSPTLSPSPRPSPTASPRPSPTASPRPSPTASPRPSPTASPRPSPTASPRPSPTLSPSPRPSPTLSPSPRPSPTASPRPSPTASPRPSPTISPSPRPSPTPSPSPRPSPTRSPSPSNPPPSNYRYVGCMRDNATRVLPTELGRDAAMTIARCAALAMARGMTVFGVEVGTVCFGGYSMQRAAILGLVPTACTTACPGDPNTKCGGPWALSVYEFAFCGGGYLGCYGETGVAANGWAMAWELSYGGNYVMTQERCHSAALSLGYEYYGLAQGSRCWFGDTLPTAIKYGTRTTCSVPCNGNQNQICGGATAAQFSLYRTDRCTAGTSVCAMTSCAAAYPAFPECIASPVRDTTGVYGGWCISRLPQLGTTAGGVNGDGGSVTTSEAREAVASGSAVELGDDDVTALDKKRMRPKVLRRMRV